jgi:hypothetical protein
MIPLPFGFGLFTVPPWRWEKEKGSATTVQLAKRCSKHRHLLFQGRLPQARSTISRNSPSCSRHALRPFAATAPFARRPRINYAFHSVRSAASAL